jgi:peptidyl-prolyl cis-trans isomerase D
MAIINTLRNKAGKIVVVVLTITMASFVLTDLFSNSSLLRGQDRDIAEIEGNEITYEDFQAKVDQLSQLFVLNAGRNPQGPEVDRIKDQAWQSFLVDLAYDQEYRALGMGISNLQLIDMVQGDNIHPHMVQMMSQTGEMDTASIRLFLQQLSEAPIEQQQSWIQFESTLPPTRLMMQLDKLMEKTIYVTTAEGEQMHMAQNSTASINYLFVPFSTIADSTIAVSDEELQAYLEENEKEYDRDEARDISYVSISIDPSAADSALVYDEVSELIEGLRSAQDDSSFVSINSDNPNPYMTYRANNLPSSLREEGEPIPVDSITAPEVNGNKLVAYKMCDRFEGDEAFVNGSHILIKWESDTDESRAEAKEKATDVLKRALNGEDFSQLAAQNSEDPSNARRGGDLGWFGENGPFVQPFKDAAFGFEGTGIIPEVVETDFGYHIIRIDEPKTNTVYKVAVLEKEFFSSKETIEEAYRTASEFQARAQIDDADFQSLAKDEGLEVQSQPRVSSQSRRIGQLVNARSLVLWLFNDADVGDVSDVFEIDNQYVVAKMTGMQEEGLARLSDVRPVVEREVRNQKKAETIIATLKENPADDYETWQQNYGEGARTGDAALSLNGNVINGVGTAPAAIGTAFSMEQGESTEPFAIPNGVLAFRITSKTMAQPQEDYTRYIQQKVNQRSGRQIPVTDFPLTFFRVMVSQDLNEAIKELSGLEDRRYKFF